MMKRFLKRLLFPALTAAVLVGGGWSILPSTAAAADRLFEFRQQIFDSNGDPLVGCKLYFFTTGTSTPKNTYSDNGLTTPNTNPVVCDSAGRVGDIFLESGTYKVELRTSADVVIWTADPVAGTTTSGTLGATTFTGTVTLQAALNDAARVSVASASTTNIGAAASTSVHVTGTTTITAFDNVAAGVKRDVSFAGALTLTHNGTSLILPGGANITTAANDSAQFLSLGSGNWLALWYKRQSGLAVVDAAGDVNALTTTDNPASSAFVLGSIGSGASNNRKFRVGEVGGWIVLETQTASASANLSFVLTSFTSDCRDYRFVIDHLTPATDNTDLLVQFSTNGGVGYDAGATDYEYLTAGQTTGAAGSASSAGDSGIQINQSVTIGNAANEYYHGSVVLINPGDVAQRTNLTIEDGFYYGTTTNQIVVYAGGGRRLATQDTDAVRFLFRTGNIASGNITMLCRRVVQ